MIVKISLIIVEVKVDFILKYAFLIQFVELSNVSREIIFFD